MCRGDRLANYILWVAVRLARIGSGLALRFRANLDNPLIHTNDAHLIGKPITSKLPSTFRVLVLGDSSPVGLGLTSSGQTFAALLERQLTMSHRGMTDVEVINAAVSGYSSEQVRRVLELRGDELAPDAVVVYRGNNDASVSGCYSDRELLEAEHMKFLRRTLSHLALYRVLCVLLAPDVPDADIDRPLVVRVSPERFRENLESIASWCRQRDVLYYLCKPPAPLLWPAGLQFRIFRHVTDGDGDVILPAAMREIIGRDLYLCLSEARFQLLYGEGDRVTRAVYASAPGDTLPLERSIVQWHAELAQSPTDPVVWNNLGVQLWRRGALDSAR
ncbi:hypothetical protein GF420_12510, partial [candidate division GN15 bacterium]|nr:hypothetical protein [candidate division GN15 bacterium]